MNWPEVPFEKLFAAPTRNGIYKPKEFHGSGCRIVNMGELFGLEFIGAQAMERVQLTDAELAVSGLMSGDLLFGRRSLVEAGAGKCSLVVDGSEPLSFESSIIRVRLDTSRSHPRFYYYWFRSPQGRGRIRSIVSGTNVKGIRGSDLKTLPVPDPPIKVQSGVSDVLSTYDDLIENNRRRIVLLEAAARQLYQEWFVRLRFPGREHTRIAEGVPEGWRRRDLGTISTFLSGGTPSKARSDFWEGEIPWVSSGELTALRIGDASLHVTEEGVEAGSRLVPPGTILGVVRGMSLAKEFRLAMTSRTVCFNQDLKAIVAGPEVEADYLFHALVAQRDTIRDRAGEASHGTKKLDTPVLASTPILVPPPSLQRAFTDVVRPMNGLWDNLDRQVGQLRTARDLLLPRLMRGELLP